MLKRKKRRSREFKGNDQVIDLEEARQIRRTKREEAAQKRVKIKSPRTVVTERQAGKKARRRMIYFVVFLIMVGIMAVSAFNIFNLKMTEARTLKAQQELQDQKSRLEKIYSQVNSPEYIEQQARQQLKMIKPGEILYILDDDQTSKPAQTSAGGLEKE